MKSASLLGLLGLGLALPGLASERPYTALLSQSQWAVDSASSHCELRHEIPAYGRVLIRRTAGQPLHLLLESNLDLDDASYSFFDADPPLWKHDGREVQLGRVTVAAGHTPIRLERADTLRVMAALDRGDQPGFRYRDPLGGSAPVEVRLNVAHYRAAADQFRRCLAAIEILRFEDVRFTPLYFEFDKAHLTRTTRERLDKVIDYLRYDEAVARLRITAHADARGSRRYNERLSERRALAVAEYLRRGGVSARLLETVAYGERRPAMSNDTAQGRAANRRAELELIRPVPPRQARAQ